MVLLVVIVHLFLLYIGRIYSHFIHHSILSCLVYSVHCVSMLLPRRALKKIDIYLCYSYFRHGLLSYCLFLLFLFFFWDGCITFGIRALSSGLASAKQVILVLSLQFIFYKDLDIEVKNPLLEHAEIFLVRNLDPDPLEFQR